MCKRTSTNKVVTLEYVQVLSASGFSVPAMSLLLSLYCLKLEILFPISLVNKKKSLKSQQHCSNNCPFCSYSIAAIAQGFLVC